MEDKEREFEKVVREHKGTKEEKVTFRGLGKGHGVGLSVWGARGLANKRYTYEQILAHYYPNTKLVK